MNASDQDISQFIELVRNKKDLAKAAKNIQDKLNVLEIKILSNFESCKKKKITMNGMTVFLRRDSYAGFAKDNDGNPVSKEDAIQALINAGLEEFCPKKIEMSSLAKYFRELEEQDNTFSEELQGIFLLNSVYKIGHRKSE